jgi:ubiquinone/menaquinone biosynthesis C-methylase UbiE
MKSEEELSSLKRFYDTIAKDYDYLRYYAQERAQKVSEDVGNIFKTSIGNLQGKRVLDLGCGTARFLRWSFECGAKSAVGLDISLEMLKAASKSLEGKGQVNLIQGSIFKLPFKEATFDLVTCSQVLTHLDNYMEPFCEIRRILADRGIFFFDIRNSLNMINQIFRLKRKLSFNRNDYDPQLTSLFYVKSKLQDAGFRISFFKGYSWPNGLLYNLFKMDLNPFLQKIGIYGFLASEIMVKAVRD